MCFQVSAILTAGSCRGIFGWAPGRHQLMCNPHKMHYHYAKGYTASLAYPWRTPLLLSLSFSLKSVLVFLLIVDCVGFYRYQGREHTLEITLYIFIKDHRVSFLLIVCKQCFLT